MNENFQAMYSITASYLPNTPYEWSTYSLTASYCSGSSKSITPYVPSPPPKDEGVQEYFEYLGYEVTWDSSRRSGECWYELMEDGHLVAQVDQGVPLDDIIMDLCQFHLGKHGVSKSDFKVCGNGPRFDAFLKRVYEHSKIRPPKQLDFDFKT